MLTDYEATVLRAHRDNDPDAVQAGHGLGTACERLVDMGLMEPSGTLTDAGHKALAEFEQQSATT